MLEKTTRVNLLYDFYGPLLTKKQQNIIELYFQHNLSLGEIAKEQQVSRQAVYDLINRSVRSLEKFEAKLQLCSRYQGQKEKLSEILAYIDSNKGIENKKLKMFLFELMEL
ncbi:YlxM family DNA-binding protein [Candidatus Contubernalis alkaliaceticus]|uniref:YlxM family DNA-binding protein n=1 Tax=Candidatus Contubernalis alkaliaceticus TaxID=338645 RepID=UPI001F4C2DFE|nr:YlxM family DNA-binding protein [Candidatus Contubernalis alkalaceticus]UNC92747.1 YlxM family DNA-binding protein [Candidatus Contubernalis alkalaceticus]